MRTTTFRVLSRRDLLEQLAAVIGVGALAACAGGEAPDPIVDETDLPTSNRDFTIEPISPNDVHYVTSCCRTPEVDGSTWRLNIGVGADPETATSLASLSLAEIEALTTSEREHTLMCIGSTPTNQRISNAIWTGMRLTELFEAFGVVVPEDAVAIRLDSADGYSTGLPITDLDLPLWLVWRMNGEPLPPDHGFPVRLLVPGRYGMKNPKWITSMVFVTEPYLGYWETRGWSDSAVYRPNALIRFPREPDVIVEGPLRIVGTAYAGSDPVVKVEVSVDGGDWEEATIEYQNGPDTWAVWHFEWEAVAGEHTVQARCTTEAGLMSNPLPNPTFDGGGFGGSMQASINVL